MKLVTFPTFAFTLLTLIEQLGGDGWIESLKLIKTIAVTLSETNNSI